MALFYLLIVFFYDMYIEGRITLGHENGLRLNELVPDLLSINPLALIASSTTSSLLCNPRLGHPCFL